MKMGTGMNIVGLIGGIWVLCAPYVVGYAPKHGNPWSGIVLGSDFLALIVIVSALIGLTGFWSLYLRALTHQEPHPLLDD